MDLTPTQAVDECISRLQSYKNSITPSGVVTKVRIGDDLQLAHDSGKPGDTLLVQPATYGGINITKSMNFVVDATLPFGRVSKDQGGLVNLTSRDGLTEPLIVNGNTVSLLGFRTMPSSPDRTLCTLFGDNIVLDRCLLLGDRDRGQKRGIAANGSNLSIIKCYIDDIFNNADAQAIMFWNGNGPSLVDDCFLSASGETLLTGGADSVRQPSHLTLTNSFLTKNVNWHSPSAVVKNTLEFKDMISATIKGNTIENSWSDGQVGYLVLFTPRNQDGKESFAQVAHIELSDNIIRNGGAGVSLSGSDNNHPSQQTIDISILNNKFDNIGGYAGDHKLFLFTGRPGCKDIKIIGNKVTNSPNVSSFLYFDSDPVENLTFTDNSIPEGEYGVMCAGGTPGIKSWNPSVSGNSSFTRNLIKAGGVRTIDYGVGNIVIP